MTFNVRMTALMDGGIRVVTVPDEIIEPLCHDSMSVLDRVYYYGQNEVQNDADHVSVSMGDVIELDGELWMVMCVGFCKVDEDQCAEVLGLGLRERMMHLLDMPHA